MSKNRLPPFAPLLIDTLDAPAWRSLSHGARSLYVSLRRVPKGGNQAYVSYRHAEAELRSSQRKIGEWFRELQYYGFIILVRHGSLGVEGKGKAPVWRLTELGTTRKRSETDLPEAPSRDFLKWNGIRFKRTARREKQNPASYGGYTPLPTSEAVPLPTPEAPNAESASYGVCIEKPGGASHGVGITSLPLPSNKPALTPVAELRAIAALMSERRIAEEKRKKFGSPVTEKGGA